MKLRRLAVNLVLSLIEDLVRNLGGELGIRARRAYYSRRFKKCGDNLIVDIGVKFVNPQQMELGNYVYIDCGTVLLAGANDLGDRVKKVANEQCSVPEGQLTVGDRCHLGIGTIIQAHGGVKIGDGFTTSAYSRVFSLSNDWKRCRLGTVQTDKSAVFYVMTPVAIGNNVWLGLGVSVVGATIGDDCFVRAGSVVSGNVPANCIASGTPAVVERPRFRECHE
jgi:acetyltransferase-like isoleucine patch superfamily enzyme